MQTLRDLSDFLRFMREVGEAPFTPDERKAIVGAALDEFSLRSGLKAAVDPLKRIVADFLATHGTDEAGSAAAQSPADVPEEAPKPRRKPRG